MMRLLRSCSLLLLLAALSTAVEEEKHHTPGHTACQKICKTGECVDQGNDKWVCMPKKAMPMKTTKEAKPKSEETEEEEERIHTPGHRACMKACKVGVCVDQGKDKWACMPKKTMPMKTTMEAKPKTTEIEEAEERIHTPSHAVCQKVCSPRIGDCVDQGNGYYACIPKTADKVMPYRKHLGWPYRAPLSWPYRRHLSWPYRTHLSWPYRSYRYQSWPYRTHLSWPYRASYILPHYNTHYVSRRPFYGSRSTLIRPAHVFRSY
jgi:hypothetical protein